MNNKRFRAYDSGSMTYQDLNFGAGDIFKRFSCVMQYTGEDDKNGMNMYEDDIIRFEYEGGGEKSITTKGIIKFGEYQSGENDYGEINAIGFYVKQIDKCPYQEWNLCDHPMGECEIIGNKYENPELIEKQRGY